MGYEPLYHDLQTRQAYAWFFGPFYFYCSLVFYILGAFLIKQYMFSFTAFLAFYYVCFALLIIHVSYL